MMLVANIDYFKVIRPASHATLDPYVALTQQYV